MEIKIGKIGKVLSGNNNIGSYIKVVDDSKDSGGFLILFAKDFEMSAVFDDWVEDSDTLRKYFEQTRWVVQWLE